MDGLFYFKNGALEFKRVECGWDDGFFANVILVHVCVLGGLDPSR